MALGNSMSRQQADKLVLAYRTPNSVEARSLAVLLDDAEIPVRIVGDFLDGAYPGVAIGGISDKELWIPQHAFAAAEPIIAQWRHEHQPAEASTILPRFSMRAILITLTVVAVLAAIVPDDVGKARLFASVLWYGVLALLFVGMSWRAWRKMRHDDSTEDSLGNLL
jgi:hypothetical protein